jgi:perosamine synthetase
MIPIAKPQIGADVRIAVEEVLKSGMLAQGSFVEMLEKQFAAFCGSSHGIAVSNGTAALHTALYAVGIGPEDEVITTPFTFVATANAVLMQGASLRFVDIDPLTFTLDPEKVADAITEKTKAIISVDLYGHPADYERLQALANDHNLLIVEDACQAHGAEYGGVKTGMLGDIGCFSFYATKNMMCGEGGFITTNNANWANRCRQFRHHGQSEQTRYEYHDIGYNYRLTDLQAAIAIHQLEHLEQRTEERISNAQKLSQELANCDGITLPYVSDNARHVFHQYTIRCDNKKVMRDDLLAHLRKAGIGATVYYPKPLHLHKHFAHMGFSEGMFPEAERAAREVLSLPVHPNLTSKDLQYIVEEIRRFVNQ